MKLYRQMCFDIVKIVLRTDYDDNLTEHERELFNDILLKITRLT